jgi:hypothetical protein
VAQVSFSCSSACQRRSFFPRPGPSIPLVFPARVWVAPLLDFAWCLDPRQLPPSACVPPWFSLPAAVRAPVDFWFSVVFAGTLCCLSFTAASFSAACFLVTFPSAGPAPAKVADCQSGRLQDLNFFSFSLFLVNSW